MNFGTLFSKENKTPKDWEKLVSIVASEIRPLMGAITLPTLENVKFFGPDFRERIKDYKYPSLKQMGLESFENEDINSKSRGIFGVIAGGMYSSPKKNTSRHKLFQFGFMDSDRWLIITSNSEYKNGVITPGYLEVKTIDIEDLFQLVIDESPALVPSKAHEWVAETITNVFERVALNWKERIVKNLRAVERFENNFNNVKFLLKEVP